MEHALPSTQILSLTERARARFWAKVDKRAPDECWFWRGGQNGRGYGRIAKPGGGMRPAHQVSWEIHNGHPFPEGKMACHTCDNPPCVNPAHIYPGTAADNMRDRALRGRQKGRRLTDAEVAEVRKLYRPRSRDGSSFVLAKRFGVHPATILRAAYGSNRKPTCLSMSREEVRDEIWDALMNRMDIEVSQTDLAEACLRRLEETGLITFPNLEPR